jgi:hypothetical protein
MYNFNDGFGRTASAGIDPRTLMLLQAFSRQPAKGRRQIDIGSGFMAPYEPMRGAGMGPPQAAPPSQAVAGGGPDYWQGWKNVTRGEMDFGNILSDKIHEWGGPPGSSALGITGVTNKAWGKEGQRGSKKYSNVANYIPSNPLTKTKKDQKSSNVFKNLFGLESMGSIGGLLKRLF